MATKSIINAFNPMPNNDHDHIEKSPDQHVAALCDELVILARKCLRIEQTIEDLKYSQGKAKRKFEKHRLEMEARQQQKLTVSDDYVNYSDDMDDMNDTPDSNYYLDVLLPRRMNEIPKLIEKYTRDLDENKSKSERVKRDIVNAFKAKTTSS